MNSAKKVAPMMAVSGLLIIAVACSSNSNKQAEKSAVTSTGAGQGTAPPAAEARQVDKALVRFVNGTSSSKELMFGDAAPFTGVKAQEITEYKELPAERHEFKLMAGSNQGAPLATDSEGLSAGKHYTVAAYTQQNGDDKLNVIVDDLTPPGPDQAKIRIINLAPTVGKADLYVQGRTPPLIKGATFAHATDYEKVEPTTAQLMVRSGASMANGYPVKGVSLEGGKLYTLIVFEGKKGKTTTKIVKDQFTSTPAGS